MPAATLIDSHCHLDFEVFDNDRMQVLQRAKDCNISDIIIPGTQKVHWQRIKQLCQQHPQLHACYGLHPYWVAQHNKLDIDELENYINQHKTLAVGECGLDFRPQQADKKTQLYFFEAQLKLAEDCRLPVVIHAVKATETVIQILKKYKNLSGMIHSYSGSLEQAKQLTDMDFYISISGSVTYDRTKKLKTVVKKIPLTSLLLETDAPDQVDQKNIGKRNEPAYLANTLATVSHLRAQSHSTIAMETTINAKSLFKI